MANRVANGCWLFIKLYWKALCTIIFPVVFTPIFIFHNRPSMRCLYVVCVMCGYWVLELIPIGVTALLPVVMFPVLGVIDSKTVAPCYMNDTNMMFLGGLMVAASLEHCNLHTRISMLVIKLVGCSPRRLLLGLAMVTMLASMWISNTAATACMVPVITATLKEIEQFGTCSMWIKEDPEVAEARKAAAGTETTDDDDESKKPTHMTICYFTSIAYSASIGGIGTLVGTATNMALKGIYEDLFPEKKEISFVEWMLVCVPIMLALIIPTLLWVQILYMGLFRPKSKDALAINMGKEAKDAAKLVIAKKIEDLGPWTFQQIAVGVLFVLLVLMWFFRKPRFMPGWADLVSKVGIKDSLPAILVIILMFLIPARADCFRTCAKDEELRPATNSRALIEWSVLKKKIPWDMIFLIGSGFAIAEGAKRSGMSVEAVDKLSIMESLPKVAVMILASFATCMMTQLTSNVAVANLVLPVLGQMAVKHDVHPLYYMMPVTIACSFAFCLPVSTPPNAIIAGPSHISTLEMLKVGSGLTIISLLVLFAIFPFLGPLVMKI